MYEDSQDELVLEELAVGAQCVAPSTQSRAQGEHHRFLKECQVSKVVRENHTQYQAVRNDAEDPKRFSSALRASVAKFRIPAVLGSWALCRHHTGGHCTNAGHQAG